MLNNLKTSFKTIAVIALAAASLTSCKKDINSGSDKFENRSTSAADYPTAGKVVVPVTADITTAVSWTAGNIYEINGVVTVRDGGSLTIAPGTFIKSSVNAGSANGVLVIAKTGTITAVGLEANPIVFTSRYLLDGDAATEGTPGDFGGVIILGNDTVNVAGGDKLIEGLPDLPKFHYGGISGTDNRGQFKYVRIEYAGFQLAPNVEVNGLTLGGVGTGTAIDHVQVSYGLDDGFEFFGGSVSPSNLIALGNDDDQFDFDNGYNGTITRGLAVADATTTHSGTSGNSDSNGIESDNNASNENTPDFPTYNRIPRTNPNLKFFTVIGTQTITTSGIGIGYRNGARVRRGSRIRFTSSVLTGYGNGSAFAGVTFDPASSLEFGDAANSNVSTTSVHGFTNSLLPASGVPGTSRLLATGSTASAWGMPSPWFNLTTAASLDFLASGTSAGRGADDGAWPYQTWVKFDY